MPPGPASSTWPPDVRKDPLLAPQLRLIREFIATVQPIFLGFVVPLLGGLGMKQSSDLWKLAPLAICLFRWQLEFGVMRRHDVRRRFWL